MSNQSRHPEGTSVGGQWAPGAAGEVEMSLAEVSAVNAALNVREHRIAFRVLGSSGSDHLPARSALHTYLDRVSDSWYGPREGFEDDAAEVERALTELYRHEYPDPQVGIGRLVGDNRACRKAEAYLARVSAGEVRQYTQADADAEEYKIATDVSFAVVGDRRIYYEQTAEEPMSIKIADPDIEDLYVPRGVGRIDAPEGWGQYAIQASGSRDEVDRARADHDRRREQETEQVAEEQGQKEASRPIRTALRGLFGARSRR